MGRPVRLGSVLFAAALCLGAASAFAADTTTELIYQGDSAAAVSEDAHFVAFPSTRDDIVPGDGNGSTDVFVLNRGTGSVEMASISTAGVQGNSTNGATGLAMSPDARYVAFASYSNNLDPSVVDDNGHPDIFLRDRVAGTTIMITTDGAGHSANDFSTEPVFSADGRFVAFLSFATNLAPLPGGDLNGEGNGDVYLYDIQAKTFELISRNDNGVQGDAASGGVTISGDGSRVAFMSHARNLDVTRDSLLYVSHVYVRDRNAGTTRLVDVNDAGEEGEGNADWPVISRNGRYIAFASEAGNFIPDGPPVIYDVFLRDTLTGTTELVSRAIDGGPGDDVSIPSSISPAGRFVVFNSEADNLHEQPGIATAFGNCFIRDRMAGTTELVNVNSAGVPGNFGGYGGGLSPSGRYLVFSSDSTNLYPGDVPYTMDIFLRDRGPQSGEETDDCCDDIGDLRGDVRLESGWVPTMTAGVRLRLRSRLTAAIDACLCGDQEALDQNLRRFRFLVNTQRGTAVSERTARRWLNRSWRVLR